MTIIDTVADHYDRQALVATITASLDAAGLNDRTLTIEDLAALDQFHSRGLAGTVDLAAALKPAATDHVLDIGSGLGGPSRYLAATYGCKVDGIDLSPSFVDAAVYLAERSNLAGKVTYRVGDALSLPFDDHSFDKAWTQHVAMNISDRETLYAEAARILRTGGRFAIYDVVQGNGLPLHYPVPWARTADTSFLLDFVALRRILVKSGFTVVSWIDRTLDGVAWFDSVRAGQGGDPRPVGLGLAMGADFPEMSANLARNLREGRAGLIEAVLEKRA